MYTSERKTNYDKYPSLSIANGKAWKGYETIVEQLRKDIEKRKQKKTILVIDYYHGTREEEIFENLIKPLKPAFLLRSEDGKLAETILSEKLRHNISDDRVFGSLSTHEMQDFYDQAKLVNLRQELEAVSGLCVVYGVGAALVSKGDIFVYGDLTRWEIQLRYRSQELDNWGVKNYDEDILRKYKRGYFIEWRVMDRHKIAVLPDADYILDTNRKADPSMVDKETFNRILETFASQPFRLVPYFDEGVWGGRWMEEICDLPPKEHNYAWCFDGVPEENAIAATINDITIELPAMDLVKLHPMCLLGEKVYSRFGAEFPIRFDFLDTMGGGNLSLQVHPLTEYIHQHFNMAYTQDESYYILDAEPHACVYLGVKDDVKEDALIPALQRAATGEEQFDDTSYINCFPIQKHDHVLIPAGTIHCSGSGAMVLEISATPYIFTMKLWDWGRVGLDGKPRPINIERGAASIQYERTTDWCKQQLLNHIQVLHEDEHLKIERTGLHELEFIETRRYWFDDKLEFDCMESVNMLNLIEGEEAVIYSLGNTFAPYTVHYAETFIIPACVGQYGIQPSGPSVGKKIAVICASIRV